MEIFAINDMCSVYLEDLELPISTGDAHSLLLSKGFESIQTNMFEHARQCIGSSVYQKCNHPKQCPEYTDCSSFVLWVYSQIGIRLPRRSIQQYEIGRAIPDDDLIPGDLVFRAGINNWYLTNPEHKIGHVGIISDRQTVIHAVNSKKGVIETPLEQFTNNATYRGAKRILQKHKKLFTYKIPPDKYVDRSDDFKWIILQCV